MNARTKYGNSPETDSMPFVPHIVTLDDGTEREVNAADPLEKFLPAFPRTAAGFCQSRRD